MGGRRAILVGWQIGLALLVGTLSGSASALFLAILDALTLWRLQHPLWLGMLPLTGLLAHLLYQRIHPPAARGTNALLEQVHSPAEGVSWKIAPLVLIATWLSHLGGASVGREGTAVQMGGSLACAFTPRRLPSLLPNSISLGIAAGFGSVFGTPLAGALFAIEVPIRGQIAWARLPGALLAAWVGDQVCQAWGIHHASYPANFQLSALLSALPLQIALAALAFGLAGRAFIALTHGIQALQSRWTPHAWARLLAGSLALWALCALLQTRDYLGLGTLGETERSITLLSAFSDHGATPASWLWKLLATALSVGSGFRGGEVTPLFFTGATLGNALAPLLHAPTDVMAALGLVCVFCAASRTPWTAVLLGTELFGPASLPFFLLASWISQAGCFRTQLYSAQKAGPP